MFLFLNLMIIGTSYCVYHNYIGEKRQVVNLFLVNYSKNMNDTAPQVPATIDVTIQDLGDGSFTLSSTTNSGRWKNEQELEKYLRNVFDSWCLAQQNKQWEITKTQLNAEIDALPWWKRLFKTKYT